VNELFLNQFRHKIQASDDDATFQTDRSTSPSEIFQLLPLQFRHEPTMFSIFFTLLKV
jgi:hypothetical protein